MAHNSNTKRLKFSLDENPVYNSSRSSVNNRKKIFSNLIFHEDGWESTIGPTNFLLNLREFDSKNVSSLLITFLSVQLYSKVKYSIFLV